MSDQKDTPAGDIIDFSSAHTPPPPEPRKSEDCEKEEDSPQATIQHESSLSPTPSMYSPPPEKIGLLAATLANTNSNAGVTRWSSQSVYLRVMGRKGGSTSNDLNLAKPFKAAPMNYSIMGLFSKESSEERQIRHLLKSYKATLIAELQHCSRASIRHRKRVADQFAEFEVHEGKLVGWGLKFIIPFFRMQAWSRLSRSTLMRDLSLELEQVMTQRIAKTSSFLQTFEESINRKGKYSLAGTQEFCTRPDQFLERDMALISMTQQLQNLDEICTSTTKRFMQFESEYAWHGQSVRKKILLRILKRYRSIPQISELTTIEQDLSWSDFCLWYANRSKIINQLELEFSDFVEDQREKEGRLFYRWHKSLYRAKEAYEAAAEAQLAAANAAASATGDGTETGGATGGFGPPRKISRAVSISAINSFRLADNSSNNYPQSGAPSGSAMEAEDSENNKDMDWGGAATSSKGKGRGGSTDSTEGNNAAAANSSGAASAGAGAGTGVGNNAGGGASDGIIALKVTPFSIKAFIKYFANDVIGVQYGIPKDLLPANLALTEALFFRRIHSHIYQYSSASAYSNDQLWRQQCQMGRFVDPTTYHVPLQYAVPQGHKNNDINTVTNPMKPIELSETVKILKEVKEHRSTEAQLKGHFDSEILLAQTSKKSDSVDAKPSVTDVGGVVEASQGVSSLLPAIPEPTDISPSPQPSESSSTGSSAPSPSPLPVGVPSSASPAIDDVLPDAVSEAPTSVAVIMPIARAATPSQTQDCPGSEDVIINKSTETLESTTKPVINPTSPKATKSAFETTGRSRKGSSSIKLRLVSDDSTIYKTCFADSSKSPPPTRAEQSKSDKSYPVSSYTYGGEVPPVVEAEDLSRMSISNIPEQYDGEEDQNVNKEAEEIPKSDSKLREENISKVGDDGLAATPSTPQSRPPRAHLNAGTVPGVRSVPVAPSSDSKRSKKHHNSNSPRSYLTANALKANDRALSAPSCSCSMCATFTAGARLQRLPKYSEGQYGRAYARSSRVMSFLSTASTPAEIINILTLSSKWLLRDAIDTSQSRETIGADLLVPLFTMMLINAQLPNVHMILQVLLDYGEYNEQGDVSYTIANLEGSILFILGLEIPIEAREKWEKSSFAAANRAFLAANRGGARNVTMSRDITDKYSSEALCALLPAEATAAPGKGGGEAYAGSSVDNSKNNDGSGGQVPSFAELSYSVAKSKGDHTDEDVQAMKQLGEWLRDQNTMEDTITILQKEGWMA